MLWNRIIRAKTRKIDRTMQIERLIKQILERSYTVTDMNICIYASSRICFELDMHSNLEGCFMIANHIQEVGMETIANDNKQWIKFLELIKKEQTDFNNKTNF